MTDNRPTYSVRITETDGTIRYFTAGNGIQQKIEINREIYFALEDCRKQEKRQQKHFDRHIEHLDWVHRGQFVQHCPFAWCICTQFVQQWSFVKQVKQGNSQVKIQNDHSQSPLKTEKPPL